MPTIDQLSVEFGADFKTLLAEFRRAEQASGEFRGKIEKEMTLTRTALDKVGSSITSFATGALASIQTAAAAGAVALLTAAFEALSASTDKARIAQQNINALQEAGRRLAGELATAVGEAAEAKKVEALATIALTESEITRLEIQRQALRDEARGSRSAATAMSAKARADAIDDEIEKVKKQIAVTKLSIAAGEEAKRIADGMRTNNPNKPDDKKPTGAAVSVARGENWLVQQAQAAIQASKGLDEYEARTRELLTLQEAELSGNRALAAQLELTQQLRKQHGPEFVAAQRDRIAALALERGEIERVAEAQRKLYAELQAAGAAFKSALGDTLLALVDKNQSAGEAIKQIWASVFNDLSRRLMNFAMDQAWNAITQSFSGIQTGGKSAGGGVGGGALGGIIGAVSNWVGGFFKAEGGPVQAGMPYIVGEKRPELFVPNVSGTIMPRVPTGGTVTLYGGPDATVRVSQLEGALRSLGLRVNRIDSGLEDRAVNATIDARRRGGMAAAY